MKVKEAEEVSEEDVKTAEELIAGIEEVRAVKENVLSFLESKEQAVAEEMATEDVPAVEPVV